MPVRPLPRAQTYRMKSTLRLPRLFLTSFALSLVPLAHAANEMTMLLNGQPARVGDYARADVKELVLDNGLLKITFGPDTRDQISATSLIKNGQELIHNLNGVQPRDTDAKRSFYHDWSASGGMMTIASLKIIKNTPALVHFALIGAGDSPYLEDHYVMLQGESGIHPYVIIKGAFGGEMRTMYRFDMNLLDWAWTNEVVAQQKSYSFLQSISPAGNVGDETWRLPDNSIYTKYDYCLYYSESPMWGHFGHGFGAFFMPVSTESYAGGPLRQELAVHQDALILNYIGGGHFSGGGSAGGTNGEKIHGPWYVYINAGDTPEAIIADAKKTAAAQQKKWPYQWVDEPLYPVKRTAVSGQLKISHDRSAAQAYVILAQPTNPARPQRPNRPGAPNRPAGAEVVDSSVEDRASILYNQWGDYIFYTQADATGKFTLPSVRPGSYTLYAWQTQGPITQSLAVDDIEVKGDQLKLGTVNWDAPYHPHLLWQIGQADRLAGEFKFGNGPRDSQYIRNVPADLTFTIGQSKELTDWYYAQKTGTWTVKFKLNSVPKGNGYLTIAVAGGGGTVNAAINGTEVGKLSYRDDASVRRSTNRSGRYARNEFSFPASVLQPGDNVLTLSAEGGGLMYDTLVLESD